MNYIRGPIVRPFPPMPLRSLTSLRFFAALLVVLSHLEFLESNSIGAVSWLAQNVFHEGYVGVTFFFVLSGFILSHSYSKKMANGGSAQQFIHARIARIFPIHFLTILIALPLVLLGRKETLSVIGGSLVANATLLQAWVPSTSWYFSFNAPSWSLSVEMFFYLAFPLLVGMASRSLFWTAAALVATKAGITIGDPESKFLLYVFPLLRLNDFIIGILLHRLFVALGPVSNRTATISQFLAVAALAAFAVLSPAISQGSRFDVYYLAPMSFMILSFAWQNGMGARLISGSTLLLLGEASFSLYMIHQLVIRYGRHILAALHVPLGGIHDVVIACGYVAISVAVSIALFKLFELPAKVRVMHFLSSKFGGRTSHGADSVATAPVPPGPRS